MGAKILRRVFEGGRITAGRAVQTGGASACRVLHGPNGRVAETQLADGGSMNQEKYDLETAEIKRLESLSTVDMTEQERIWHRTAISDAYWRRRMAQRTDDEVARNVCAP